MFLSFNKSFSFSNDGTNVHPIIKNITLKVDILIGGFGISRDVGPIITAYIEPIINPIIQYIVLALYFLSNRLTVLTVINTPTNIPLTKIIIAGK